MISVMASCILTEGKYNQLCISVTGGYLDAVVKLLKDVCQEQDTIVSLETFTQCSHMYHRMAPLVLAAQFGHIEIVRYLCNLLTQEEFVNTVATVYSIANSGRSNSGDELHHVTALNAACIRGHLSIVKLLVERNASLSVPDCTGSVPLCEAVFHGRSDIVKYLCEQGADVHIANNFGWRAIHIAALKNDCVAYKCLIKHRADSSHCTPDGFTPLHIAAQNGNIKIISQNMNWSQAVKTSFCDKVSMSNPLNLAAAYSSRSWTHQKIIDTVFQLPECSEINKCDAYLLMGVSRLIIGEHSQAFSHWQKAVTIIEKNVLALSCLELFGRREIQNSTELSELCGIQNPFAVIEMWYQAVLIWEKRIGFCDMTYWEILRKAIEKIRSKPEREILLLRGMEMVDRYLLPRLSDGFILPENFEEFYDSWVRNCFFDGDFEISSLFTTFVSYVLKVAKAISSRFYSLSSMYCCKKRSPLKLLSTILEMFNIGLKSNSSKIENACYELGEQFVEDFLMLNDDTTILHKIIEKKLFRDLAIIDFLVQCGASRALNVRCKGKTCLHIACMSGDMDIITLLYDHGAHIDAVDEQDGTPLHIIKELHPNKVSEFVLRFCFTPLPLQCLSAKAVLDHGLYYDCLPQTVREFIALHCGE